MRRRFRIVLLTAATPVAALAVAACGTSHPSGQPSPICGTGKTIAGVPVQIKVGKGTVSCPSAMAVEKAYLAALRSGDVKGNGGGAPVKVNGWTCQAFQTPVVLKTGETSACRSKGEEILAVLPPPSAVPTATR